MKDVDVSNENVEPPQWLPDLSQLTERVCREIGRPEWEVGVLLCDDERISELNRTYREVDGPTDVLTFEGESDGNSRRISGDIAISIPTVAANATEFGVSVREEFLRVYVHALLHLAGYTHEGADLSSERAVEHPMLGFQERLVTTLQEELNS